MFHIKHTNDITSQKEIERIFAINEEVLKKIKKKVENKTIDINFQLDDGRSGLIIACNLNNFEYVKYFVERGINVNLKDNEFKNSALLVSICHGNLEITKYLIENGADINSKNNIGDTALHFACMEGHFETVKYLHEKGMDLNEKNMENNCAIIFAVGNGHYEIVKYLIENNVDLDVKNAQNMHLIFSAIRNQELDTIELLLKSNKNLVNIWDETWGTPLIESIKLLNHNTNLRQRNTIFKSNISDFNKEKIYQSVILNKLYIVKLLIEYGADTNRVDFLNYSPLFHAILIDNYELVELLINNNADVNYRKRLPRWFYFDEIQYGDSILAEAYKYPNYEIINLLKSKNAIYAKEVY
jgi:ankyrin repeat protein